MQKLTCNKAQPPQRLQEIRVPAITYNNQESITNQSIEKKYNNNNKLKIKKTPSDKTNIGKRKTEIEKK